jgi:hypothetical protein
VSQVNNANRLREVGGVGEAISLMMFEFYNNNRLIISRKIYCQDLLTCL